MMQLNYSYLKILKLKIQSLFLVMLFCAHVTWWKHFNTLPICVFPLPFFLNAKSLIFAVGFFEKPPNWPKIQHSLFLQNNQIVERGNFVTGIKIFTRNKLIVPIGLRWYLPIVNLLSSFLFCRIQDNFFL